jgi:hypothetical protein
MEHRIQLKSAKRRNKRGDGWIGIGKAFVYYNNELINETDDEMCDTARWLLNNGYATREDTLVSYRDDQQCLTGNIGWFADRRILETREQGPYFTMWTPLTEDARDRLRKL